MNRLIKYLILLILFTYSCNDASKNLTHDEIVSEYIKGLNESNFKKIKTYISDSLILIEEGFTLTKSLNEYYTFFQWDSVFFPKYTLLKSHKINNNLSEIILSKICKRIEYLHDSEIVYKQLIQIDKNEIIQIETKELTVFDTLKWSSRRDTLVKWIENYYPDLNGFEYDQTLTGAEDYIKAIELYKKNN